MINWRAISAVLLLAGSLRAGAVQLEFTASVDRTRAGQADPVLFTLTITSDENLPHVPAPQLDLREFYAEGPSISTRMEMVNFRTTFTRQLQYSLIARRTGRLTIGPARLEIGGQAYQTKAIQLDIVPGSLRQAAGGQEKADLKAELFVRTQADQEMIYVGQQLVLDYELCYRFALNSVGFKELPDYSGFWAKELFVAQQLHPQRETIGGEAFNVAPLRRVVLFPTSAGTHQIDPLAISCKLPQRGRSSVWDFLDDPFFGGGRGQHAVVSSQALRIEVMPLPAGKPPEFTGAVGRFSLQARAQPLELAAGDPVTLKVEISGQGNIDAVKPPALEGLDGFTVYDPKVEEEEKVEDGRYGGSRRFEYLLIPQRGGPQEIPPVRFAYFDPKQAEYRILQSAPIRLVVRGGAAEAGAAAVVAPKQIAQVGQDIRHIKPDVQEFAEQTQLHQSGVFWALQGLLPLAFAGLLFYQRHQQRLAGDVAYARRRRARGEAGRRLRRAAQLLAQGDSAAFHGEIHRAVLTFLADHLNRSAAGLTSQSRTQSLAERGVDEPLIRTVEELLAQCDFARFAPVAPGREEMAQVQAQAEEIIAALEKLI